MAKILKKYLFILIFFLWWPLASYGEMGLVQRVIVGVPILSYSRQTLEKSNQALSPYGVASEYTLFLTPTMAISGQFVANNQSSAISPQAQTVFQGGGGALTWYFKGGVDPDYQDTYIRSQVSSRLHLYAQLGVAMRSYNFTLLDSSGGATQPSGTDSGVVVKDTKDVTKGSFVAPFFAFGGEVPVLFNIYVGSRAQAFNSLASDTSPSITGLEFWFYAGTQVNNFF